MGSYKYCFANWETKGIELLWVSRYNHDFVITKQSGEMKYISKSKFRDKKREAMRCVESLRKARIKKVKKQIDFLDIKMQRLRENLDYLKTYEPFFADKK